jgi:hypothetical protein
VCFATIDSVIKLIIISIERRNVGDKWLMELSKQISIDQSVPYDILKENLEEDAKVPVIRKYYANTLSIRASGQSIYQLIYPDH